AIRDGAVGEVPPHLRDAHYEGAGSLGHGVGYDYPHDHADAAAGQQYLPDELVGTRWWHAAGRD
ncbi:MAG: replication-associated recombination protein A, partial [Actinomycetota bacterium]